MKYNNEILNEIVEISNQQSSLNLDNIANGYIEMFKKGAKIYIKPKNRGRLTNLKKRTGKTEAELYKNGSSEVRKMITFARNSRKWNKK